MARVQYETYKFEKPSLPSEEQYYNLRTKMFENPALKICPHYEPFFTKKGLEMIFATILISVILGFCYLLIWVGLEFMEFVAGCLALAYFVYVLTWIVSSLSYFWFTVEIEEYYRDLKEYAAMYETYKEFSESFSQKHYS